MKYGYARVLTDDQKADLQIAALKTAGCEHVFTDTASGSSAKRPELTRCLASLRAGDVLVVWKLDRLGRSLSHLVAVLSDLQKHGVAFLSLTEAIDTESAARRLMGHILGAFAEFERSLIVERIEELIALAKELNSALKRGETLNLNDDELAFYDALEVNEASVRLLGDEILKQIAKELAETIRKNASIDWNRREAVREKLRILVKNILRKYKYPPDKQAAAVELVIKQAETITEAQVAR